MTNFKYIFLVFLSLFVFVLVLGNKEKRAIQIMIFCLPIAVPFQTDKFALGVNGLLIFTIWFAQRIKYSQHISKKVLPTKKTLTKVLVYFLLSGFLIGLMNLSEITLVDNFTPQTPLLQLISYSIYLLSMIFFVDILIKYKDDHIFHMKLINIFTYSIFLQIIIVSLPFIGLGSLYDTIFMKSKFMGTDGQIGAIVHRFSGTIGDYELTVDYSLIIISLAFISYFRQRELLSIITMSLGAVFALMSGTRSFLVIMAIFLIIIIFYNLPVLRIKKSLYFLLGTGLIIFSGYYVYTELLQGELIFERWERAYILFQSGYFLQASNRDILSAIPDVLNYVGILGGGSFYFNVINNNEMVSHNLLLAAYAKYGVPGVGAILFLFFYFGFKLVKKISITTGKYRNELVVFLALLVSLFAQQMKISALRILPIMLVYCFLFILIFFALNRNEQKRT
ncbi:MAG: hypothetical protein Q8M94_19285 [Ignavibacteria bacterium]|nr:hypothetical protein [Ignavibacteria bacterium]